MVKRQRRELTGERKEKERLTELEAGTGDTSESHWLFVFWHNRDEDTEDTDREEKRGMKE